MTRVRANKAWYSAPVHIQVPSISTQYTWHLVMSQSKACLSKVGATANYINGQPLPLSLISSSLPAGCLSSCRGENAQFPKIEPRISRSLPLLILLCQISTIVVHNDDSRVCALATTILFVHNTWRFETISLECGLAWTP